MENCFICEKHEGKNEASKYHIISTSLISIYHMYPKDNRVYLGHVFIEMNRHISGLADMSVEEAAEVGKYQMVVSKVFSRFFDAEHIYSFVFGDGVDHLHIHLIPRYRGAPIEYRGVKVDEWSGAPHGDEETTIDFCRNLKERILDVLNELV